MTQVDWDRLVTLKKAKKKLITQREAAEELRLSVRHVKRLLYALKKHGDKAVVHGFAQEAFESKDRGEDRAASGEEHSQDLGYAWIYHFQPGSPFEQQELLFEDWPL